MTTTIELKVARISALRAALPIGEALGRDLRPALEEIERLREEIAAEQRAGERRPRQRGATRGV